VGPEDPPMSTSSGMVLGFLLKVFGLSFAIAFAIKTVGPQIPIPPTVSSSLLIVLLPPVVMAGILLWQWSRPRSF
ncbi:MAG TPA: hypothetical protein V6D06_02620, partial [Trichocoleus sp.]